MTTATRPTPEQIDDLCLAYDNARIAKDNAEQELSTAKGDLLAAVRTWGYVPAHAEKTQRLEGQMYIADATTGTTVEINEAKVDELQSELSRLKKPKVFRSLFQRSVKYSLIKGAPEAFALAVAPLAEEVTTRLLGIFTACFKVNAKAPSLTVDLAETLRKKEEAAAAKQIKKRAKKGKAA